MFRYGVTLNHNFPDRRVVGIFTTPEAAMSFVEEGVTIGKLHECTWSDESYFNFWVDQHQVCYKATNVAITMFDFVTDDVMHKMIVYGR